jgi:benzylsuccinate CoA-transferase BbsE subunit
MPKLVRQHRRCWALIPMPADAPLLPYRILDLTTDRAWLTGKILADLGADVIKVERPGGDPGRFRGPYAGDEPSPESSLAWWAHNRGKRSVTLALDTADGRKIFLKLVATADAVVESFDPGQLEAWHLGWQDLAVVNPGIVLTRVSPFGQSGPYANFKANDLILAAIGGPAWMAGDEDRPPVRTTTPQYWLHAAAEAAVHTEVAIYYAATAGQGQQIDVSAQLAAVRTLMNAFSFPRIDGTMLRRTTFGSPGPSAPYRQIFRSIDGHVMVNVGFGLGLPGYLRWMTSEGFNVPGWLSDLPGDLGPEVLARQPANFGERVSNILDEFFATRSKRVLTRESLERRLMLVPINNTADIMRDEHLAAREYFTEVQHDSEIVTYPTVWAHMGGTPLADTVRAPHVGEHTRSILIDGLGLNTEEVAVYTNAGVI